MSQEVHSAAGAAFTELVLEVFRLNGRLLVAGDRMVGPLGLTSARWQVLGAVAAAPMPEPVARLARNMGLNRQGVQRIVDALEGEGWLAFAPNPHHRRAKLVNFTAAGASLYEAVSRLQVPWANETAAGLDVGAIETAVAVLSSLRARLETYDPEPDLQAELLRSASRTDQSEARDSNIAPGNRRT